MYQRRENEDFLTWKFRVLKQKLNREIDLDWSEIAELLNLDCSADHLRKTAYGIVEAASYYESRVPEPNDIVAEIEEKQRELRKERVKLADARREMRKFERYEARMEVLMDEIKLHMDKLPQLDDVGYVQKVGRTGVLLLSDWHYGADIDNEFNKYNREIAKERIEKLTSDTITYIQRNNISYLVIAQLGDIINGQIHVSTRVQNEIESVQQTMEVTELLAQMINKLSSEVTEMKLINIIGNHGRTIANKHEVSTVRENFEYFITWYLKERLKHVENLTISEDTNGLYTMNIEGKEFAFAHGNFESLSKPENLCQAYGKVFDYICVGHFHHTHIKEIGKTSFIVNNSLCGTDDYALSIRKTSQAAQKLLVLDDKGIESIINIRFGG